MVTIQRRSLHLPALIALKIFRKLIFFACSRFLIFYPFFQGGQLTPFAPMCGPPCRMTLQQRRIRCRRVPVSLSVCLSVTSRYCIETTGRTELVFGRLFSHLWSILHWVTRKFGFLKSKGKLAFYTSLWNLSDSEPLDREFRQVNCVDNKTRRRSSSFTRWWSARRLG